MSEKTDRGSREQPERQPIVELDFLQGLISAVDGSGIDSLEISRGGTRIRIAKSPPPSGNVTTHAAPAPQHAAHAAPPQAPVTHAPAAAPTAPVPEPQRFTDIKSPMVGTFYRSASPDSPSYVEIGSKVVKGQTLCILEAMKLMNELQADVAGTIRELCVENAEPVEYGQVLFRIEPDA